jgi:hypothetical protein
MKLKLHKSLLNCAVAAARPGFAAIVMLVPAQFAFAATGEPYNLAVASYPTPSSATLTWAATGPIQSFRVERRILGSRAWLTAASVDGAQRSFAEGNLNAQTAFEYRVVSFYDGGPAAGQLSNATAVLVTPGSWATQADYDAAATPRGVDAQAVSPTEIIVTWADQTDDETNFKVERRQGGGSWNAVAMPAANVTLFKDVGLAPASTYEYRVSVERTGRLAVPSAGKIAATPANDSGNFLRYVDGSACNTGTGTGTLANPYKTIQAAAYNMRAGQTLLVRSRTDCATPTLYKTVANAAGKHGFAVVDISNDAGNGQYSTGGVRSGRADAWITYRNYPGERPKIRTSPGGLTSGGLTNADSGNNHGISVRNASYIIIDGFEIEGHLNDVPLTQATALNDRYKTEFLSPPTVKTPITAMVDSNGISVGNSGIGSTASNQIPHHVIVRNNVVYNFTGGGINGLAADWLTIENNRVSNVGWYSPYGSSAINLFKNKDVDSNTVDYKLIIRGNTAADSGNLFPCSCYSYRQPTDGNGIIIDSLKSTSSPNLPTYGGRTIVYNNIVTNNGGRGIHTLSSENVDVVFNTMVRNSTIAITGDGELTSQSARKVRAYNNIIVPRPDRPAYMISFSSAAAKTADAATVDFNHNILFGGTQRAETSTTGSLGANNRVNLDPKFSAGSGLNAFKLSANSPAVNSAWTGVAGSSVDVFQAPRPRSGLADVGAVESF